MTGVQGLYSQRSNLVEEMDINIGNHKYSSYNGIGNHILMD